MIMLNSYTLSGVSVRLGYVRSKVKLSVIPCLETKMQTLLSIEDYNLYLWDIYVLIAIRNAKSWWSPQKIWLLLTSIVIFWTSCAVAIASALRKYLKTAQKNVPSLSCSSSFHVREGGEKELSQLVFLFLDLFIRFQPSLPPLSSGQLWSRKGLSQEYSKRKFCGFLF